jgi:TetR/AcrR family transcriptional regulator, tetracycline repressor protein
MSAPRRRPLTRERVVATALRIVDRDGLDALTMRALGRELGVDPMAVYHHLPNKAAVLDGVVEAVLGEVPLDAPGELPWTEELAALARGYRDALRAHPNALPVVATRPDVSPAALRLLDTALGILLRAGFDAADALKAVHTASCLVVGHALDESGLAVAASEELSVADVAAMQQRGLETGEYPNLAAAAPAADGLAADDSFEAGLAALIAGFRPSIANGRVSGG